MELKSWQRRVVRNVLSFRVASRDQARALLLGTTVVGRANCLDDIVKEQEWLLHSGELVNHDHGLLSTAFKRRANVIDDNLNITARTRADL